MSQPSSLLRTRGQHDSGKVTMVELFFDLVFVYAVTQLSHSLLAKLTMAGAVEIFALLLAVWWVWIYTSWATNWLDPERIPVRMSLFVLMFAGLLMSVSIPAAFAERGLLFAAAYVFMQVGRTLFFLWAVRSGSRNMIRNFQRILAWLLLSAAFWIAGGLTDGNTRLLCWAAALFIEFISPAMLFWVPGLGRSSTADWDVDGNHMAERCALFVIIALGESLLVTGATFADQSWNFDVITAFVIAVVGTVALWWIYFDSGAQRAHHRIIHSDDPGQQARVAYTYIHTLIIASIIVCAVADELVLAHPDHASNAGISALLGGPALYVLGCALFKWVTSGRRMPPLSHLVGLGLLTTLLPFAYAHVFSALVLSALTTSVLVAVWESHSVRHSAS
ncbi:low temperature requirement protein A [Viridibacterium curvum]|uniref:Low temperature requirement protein A n=1 Tax=Viridibacterium curvum TaxID=1101404 RepID=A0ABP9QQ26_9RHOO